MESMKNQRIQHQIKKSRVARLLSTCFALIMIVGSLQAQKLSDHAFEKIVMKKMTEFPLETQFSIGYISDDEVVYDGVIHKSSGVERIDNAESVFEIGSVTKVFTAYLLSLAVQDKLIDLDDNIWDRLESEEKDQPKITYKQLSNHTSGIPRISAHLEKRMTDGADPYKSYGQAELQEYLNTKLKLETEPGRKYAYSNVAVGLLGYSVSRHYGADYRSVMQRKVLDQLEMQSSYLDPDDVKENLVGGIGFMGQPTVGWHFGALGGAGCMLSNSRDMIAFIKANFKKDKVLKRIRKKTFEINDFLDMGLGWHIVKSEDGHKYYFHNGGTGGYTSFLCIDTDRKLGMVILTNVSGFHPKMTDIDKMGFALMKELGKR